jgi:FixJ family two-component response regulator
VHIVDDDEAMRVGIARLLRAEGYEVRLHESAGHFLLTPPHHGPGCVILDLQMPGPSGLELQEAMSNRGDSLPVIFLSGHGDIRQSVHAIQRGAVDFLTKPVDADELLRVVEKALAHQRESAAAAREQRELAARYAKLTPREREILDHLVAGDANKRIAAAMGASERTIKRDRARLMAKLGATSLAELVLTAARLRSPSAKP